MTTRPVTRWGILGTGNIARQFARGLQTMPDAELIAVGSRRQETARAFAESFGARRAHSSYEALAADPEIEAVYVATPHTLHADNTLLCLEAGKAVLCEKPFALNALEAQRVIDAARAKKLFLMEAMWTRFFPLMTQLRELIREGRIGEVRLVQADFGFRGEVNPEHRLYNPSPAAARCSTWASTRCRWPRLSWGRRAWSRARPTWAKPGSTNRTPSSCDMKMGCSPCWPPPSAPRRPRRRA